MKIEENWIDLDFGKKHPDKELLLQRVVEGRGGGEVDDDGKVALALGNALLHWEALGVHSGAAWAHPGRT